MLNKAKSPLEKRALLKVFHRLIPLQYQKGTGRVSSNELHEISVQNTMREAGLDDKVWVSKLRESFGIGDLRLLQNYDKPQFEAFLADFDNPDQNIALRRVLSKLSNIDMVQENRSTSGGTDLVAGHNLEEERPQAEGASATEEELLKGIDRGLLFRGVYFSDKNLRKLSTERDIVIDVKTDLECKIVNTVHPIWHHRFSERKTWEFFDKHIDKHIGCISDSVGENVWGINIAETESTQRGNHENETFACSVNYQLIAVRCIELKQAEMELRKEAIKSLQEIERYLEASKYQSQGHFQDFFKKFGTHVNHGKVQIGGMLKSTACCKGFLEEDRDNVSAVVSEASENAFYLSLSNEVRTGISLNAYEVLGKTSQMCAEDLQNITVTVHRIGGPQHTTDHQTWTSKLDKDLHLHKVICRNSPPLPIWKLLDNHTKDFTSADKLADAMLKEWQRETLSTDGHFRELPKQIEGDTQQQMVEINCPHTQNNAHRGHTEAAIEDATNKIAEQKCQDDEVRNQEEGQIAEEQKRRHEELEKLAFKIFQKEDEEEKLTTTFKPNPKQEKKQAMCFSPDNQNNQRYLFENELKVDNSETEDNHVQQNKRRIGKRTEEDTTLERFEVVQKEKTKGKEIKKKERKRSLKKKRQEKCKMKTGGRKTSQLKLGRRKK